MTDQSSPVTVPSGWKEFNLKSSYASSISPIYLRTEPVGLGFISEERHANLNGVVHGGALATLADMGLFFVASEGKDRMNGATLTLNLNYLRPAPVGRFLHCEGRIVREGSSIIFVEGGIFDGDTELLTFDGLIKRFRPDGG